MNANDLLQESGTFDLAGSIGKPKIRHVETFGGEELVGQFQHLNESATQPVTRDDLITSNDLRMSH
jgi:hypothetical protein